MHDAACGAESQCNPVNARKPAESNLLRSPPSPRLRASALKRHQSIKSSVLLRLARGAGAHRLIDRAHLSIAYGNAHRLPSPVPPPSERDSPVAPFSPKWNYTRRTRRFYDLRDEENSSLSSIRPILARFRKFEQQTRTGNTYEASSDFRYGAWSGTSHFREL